MLVIYLNHSQACMNQSSCLQWSHNDFKPQVGKHQRLKGDTMAILMLIYASIKAVTMSRKQKLKITH